MSISSESSEGRTITQNQMNYSKRNLWSGLFFGIGVMAFVDEVIFHMLLQWHHFYDLSTTAVGIFSDGLLMSFAWFAAIGSLFMFADLRRRNALWMKKWIGAVFLGAGIFQLFDGIVNHKLLRVHQIRYDVESILPYDIVWNVSGALLLAVGIILLLKTKKSSVSQKEGD